MQEPLGGGLPPQKGFFHLNWGVCGGFFSLFWVFFSIISREGGDFFWGGGGSPRLGEYFHCWGRGVLPVSGFFFTSSGGGFTTFWGFSHPFTSSPCVPQGALVGMCNFVLASWHPF